MPNVSHQISDDVTPKREGFRRFEVITGERRRREWTVEEKLAMVAESFSTTTSISEVARRHGINRNQLFHWRRQFRRGELGDPGPGAFVPVAIAGTVAVGDAAGAAKPVLDGRLVPTGAVEVVIGVATVWVSPSADEQTLRRVLEAVRWLG